jgi:hypothetical protein
MASGIFWEGATVHSADRILTWQDDGPLRFWIGSLRTQNDLHEIVSVEVVRRKLRSKPPTDNEVRNRFATMPLSNARDGKFEDLMSASRIKDMPWAVILLERAGLVMDEMSRAASRSTQVIQLASAKQRSSRSTKAARKQPERNLGTSNADSILIAKVYTDLAKISRAKIAQRTGDFLGIPVGTVHGALRVARRNGWLTSAGAGKAGGILTAEGLLEFASADGPSRLEELGLPVGHGRG